MSSASVLYMVLILGLVWGGFAYCLFLLVTRREGEHDGDMTKGESDERRR